MNSQSGRSSAADGSVCFSLCTYVITPHVVSVRRPQRLGVRGEAAQALRHGSVRR